VATVCNNYLLEGTIADVLPDRRVHIQFARVTGRVILRTWIEHLLLATQLPHFRTDAATWLVGRKEEGDEPIVLKYEPVSDPQALLADLVSVFEHGCRSPIPLFPDLAYAFVTSKEPQLTNPLIRGWEGVLERDAAVARVFGRDARIRVDEPMLTTRDPNYPSFGALSRRVFEPLLGHLANCGTSVDDEAV